MVSSASMCQTQNETDLQSCVQSQHQAMYYCCLCLLSKQNIDCIGEVGYPSIFTSPHSIDGFFITYHAPMYHLYCLYTAPYSSTHLLIN